MTKNEIIRELSKFNPSLIGRLFIVYHNRSSNVRYTFTYADTFSHISTHGEAKELVRHEEVKELARVLLSLYKLRRYVECIRVVYWVRTSENDWLERHYDSCPNYVYTISDFIKTIKK